MIALALTATGLAQTSPKATQSLLQHATRLANASDWVTLLYSWCGPHTVLTYRGIRQSGEIRWFVKVDTQTGCEQNVPVLNRQWQRHFAKQHDTDPHCILEASVSPDGDWLYLYTKFTFKYAPEHTGINLTNGAPDGGMLLSMHRDDLPRGPFFPVGMMAQWHNPMWLRSKSQFVLMDRIGDMILRSAQSDETTNVPPSAMPPGIAIDIEHGYMLGLGVIADKRALARLRKNWKTSDAGNSLTVLSLALHPDGGPPQETDITLPHGRSLSEVQLSPDGTHLLLTLLHTTRNNIDMTELWTCRLDGTQKRYLGWLRTHEDNRSGAFAEQPGGIAWTPDSRHISFVYNDVLYSLPAQEKIIRNGARVQDQSDTYLRRHVRV
jgi:hypothetical protein